MAENNQNNSKKDIQNQPKSGSFGLKFFFTFLTLTIGSSLLLGNLYPEYEWTGISKIKNYFYRKIINRNSLDALIEPEELYNLIKDENFNDKYRIVEAFFGPESKDVFRKEHIPNALYFNSMNGVEPSSLYPRGMPKESAFKEYISSLGISNKHHVIIYDRSDFGFYSSSRVWFMFRLFGHESVSILSGGLRKWKSKNFDTDNKITVFPRQEFKTYFNPSLIRSFEDIIKNQETRTELIVDAREREELDEINPKTGKKSIIPNSVNVPYSELFDKNTNTLKDTKNLLELMKQNGVDFSKPLVSTCLTGVRASSLAFAAYLLGIDSIPIYLGSWTEYSQRANV